MMENKIIETERLLLKPMSTDDSQLIFELYNSPNFIRFIGDRNIKTVDDAENYIKEKFLPQIERLGYGNYLITRKEDGKKIGSVGIFERDGLDVHDIGFSFLPEFEKKGYGYESASKLMEVGFKEFGLKKISAITTKENISSQKLIEKLGLKFQKMVSLPNDEEELRYYEIEKSAESI
ncbi:GNAT family N-acetyltransferase [Chryseobacterium koreense]|uniref:GNAT family N-acetyltransferase n=1 Tax=Chryseobacterium koreense TaxID=232216 RepID=UPI0026EA718D|nr:GNAT family N-acetyltransferase [Chryseobacterium koreense]